MGSDAAPIDDDDGGQFILDSGSSVHATGDASLLREARAPGPGDAAYVTRRDGRQMGVAAVGSIATPEFAIPDVHCVPDLGPGRTLVSVSQLALCGLAVMFCAAGCVVVDATGAVVGEGRMRGDDEEEERFYRLAFLRVVPRGPPAPYPAQPSPPPAVPPSNPCPAKNPFWLPRVPPHEPAPPHSMDERRPTKVCS